MAFKAHPTQASIYLSNFLLSSSVSPNLHYCHVVIKPVHLLFSPNLHSLKLVTSIILQNLFFFKENPVRILLPPLNFPLIVCKERDYSAIWSEAHWVHKKALILVHLTVICIWVQKLVLLLPMATHSSILAWRIPWTEEPGQYSPRGRKESDTTEQLHSLT